MKEIGSEFWNEFKIDNRSNNLNIPEWLQLGKDYKLLFFGRTALDFIIKDIKFKHSIKSAYLPSYCCASMVIPFIENDIKVDFYNVKYSKQNGFEYDIDYDKSTDIFLAMNYYGFTQSEMKVEIEAFKDKKVLVIEDITHSLFNSKKSYADYGIASIRKWMPIPSGAIAINYTNKFQDLYPDLKENSEYIRIKLTAMEIKREYMESDKKELKPIFLEKFDEINTLLDRDYKDFNIDNISLNILKTININSLINRRKKNKAYIYTNLKETNDIRLIYSEGPSDICPIFIPVRVNKNKRDILIKHLIKNDIYSPIHWNCYPESFNSKELREINQTILSLVCDQRYGEKEMKYMVSVINDFV